MAHGIVDFQLVTITIWSQNTKTSRNMLVSSCHLNHSLNYAKQCDKIHTTFWSKWWCLRLQIRGEYPRDPNLRPPSFSRRERRQFIVSRELDFFQCLCKIERWKIPPEKFPRPLLAHYKLNCGAELKVSSSSIENSNVSSFPFRQKKNKNTDCLINYARSTRNMITAFLIYTLNSIFSNMFCLIQISDMSIGRC